ncbi:MAG: aminopeptidase N [Desulfotalea sp.]|nr:MAG: aminopeptidase N [Desulfotalea sp.]
MKNDQPVAIYRKDYSPFPYLVDRLDLTFQLYDDKTIVKAKTVYRQNTSLENPSAKIVLFGEDIELLSMRINGATVAAENFEIDEKGLVLSNLESSFTLEIETVIYPQKNSSLEGLYRSSGNYCTQCEAEGFRKITYYADRPDVLTIFTTRIEADKKQCPVMLSNGNLLETGELIGDRHFAVWEDPFAKPCYLFALVAGQLVSLNDQFTTKSGRKVDLKIYVEERNKDKCGHAMESLKKSMRWDEDVYGLEYDLDIFMIVAVDDFNMGAMENKGLNVFNSKYVLSTPESATDTDYLGIEGVIGHEYFHNWTGNRVTCRDWFQLSLKEGLTVFRDQEFSSDMNSRAVQRIDDVRLLRNVQFKEDGGPMAHPVRPDSFVEINNFYTSTIYNKGAEVIRMMHTLLGAAAFRQGMDLYFKRHDGQAVTCDDFVVAMEDASGVDLLQFRNWYSQAGTPTLTVQTEWLEDLAEYKITIEQSCKPTPGQETKLPFHIPIKIGLLAEDGENISQPTLLELKQEKEVFTFKNITRRPVLSFLRDFSAPVRVEPFQDKDDLAFLMANDANLFNRWDCANQLSTKVILAVVAQLQQGEEPCVEERYLDAVEKAFAAEMHDKDLVALALQLPTETTLVQEMDVIYPQYLHDARMFVKTSIARRCKDVLLRLYHGNSSRQAYSITPEEKGQRSLKNLCLSYLMALEPVDEEVISLCVSQFNNATNMTDSIAAVSLLASVDTKFRAQVIDDFYEKWKDDTLVLDKWFALQALSELPGVMDDVRALMGHSAFTIKNPNKVRALVGAFCSGNHVRFHSENGEGYRFLSTQIIALNKINPQIAARLLSPMIGWKRYEPKLRELMNRELNRILEQKDLSQDVHEVVKTALA